MIAHLDSHRAALAISQLIRRIIPERITAVHISEDFLIYLSGLSWLLEICRKTSRDFGGSIHRRLAGHPYISVFPQLLLKVRPVIRRQFVVRLRLTRKP